MRAVLPASRRLKQAAISRKPCASSSAKRSPVSEKTILVVEQEQHGTRVAYAATPAASEHPDLTVLEFGVSRDTNEMWIGRLSVATSSRSSGLGRELVRVAEEAARRMGIRTINVFPYIPAASFWEKMVSFR